MVSLDFSALKRNFPAMFEFYSSWARLKKSELEGIQRPGMIFAWLCYDFSYPYTPHDNLSLQQALFLLLCQGRFLARRLWPSGASEMDRCGELLELGL